MKTSILIRSIILILCIAMFSSAFIACTDNGGETDTTTTNGGASNPDVTTDPVGEEVYPSPIPGNVNFNDKQFKILYWDDVEHQEFFYEDQTGDAFGDAIIERNNAVESTLGVELLWEPQAGNANNNGEWNKRMEVINEDLESQKFIGFAGYSLSVAAAAVNGYCYNLLNDSASYFNFEDPTYWPERLLTQATFGDNLYFCSGDISANLLYMMYVCFVNTDLLEQHQLRNPQELVEDLNWTYNQFIKMCANVWEDADDVEGKSDGDIFGYMSSGIHNDPWFYGTGAVIAEYDAEGKLAMSESMKSNAVIDTYERIHSLFYNSNDAIYTSSVKHQKAFAEGRLLFMMDRCRVSFKVIASGNYDVNYAILPCPKYNPQQESYVTVVGNPFTLYGMFSKISEEDAEFGSAVLEYYAYESYLKVTPAVFEISLKTRYVQDDISSRMYDIVRQNVTFDIGRIFSANVLKSPAPGQEILRAPFKSQQYPSWTIVISSYETAINNNCELVQDTLDP